MRPHTSAVPPASRGRCLVTAGTHPGLPLRPGGLLGVLLGLLLLAARAADPPAPGAFPDLIAGLGAGDPAVRDQATRQLVAAGREALGPLTAGLRAGTAPPQASFEVIVQLGLAADAETSRLARTRLDELARSPDTELAAAAWRHRRELDRRIADRLRDLGAIVFLTETGITEVKLERQPIAPEQLRLLRGLPHLTDLSLEQTDLDDSGLALLGELPALEWLNLYRTRISDDGLRQIARFPRLESLAAGETRIGGTGLVHLKTLSRLEYLGLRGTTVIDAALGDIASLTNLTGLHLGGTRVTDEGLSRLVTLSRVQQIWLHATRVSDVAIDSLLQFKQLRRVDLTETTVSEEGIRRLRTAFPDIIIER